MGFKKSRIRAGFSVLQAADKLGVSDAAIYMWENGEMMPKASRLKEIANLYGVAVDDLLKEDDGQNE